MVITVAGGVKETQVLRLVREHFEGLKRKAKGKAKRFESKQRKPKVALHPKKKEQAHFVLGFLGNPMDNKDRFAEGVLAVILGQGMSSRLFTEVRERRGLAYAIKTSIDHYVDTGYIGTYTGVDIKRIDEAIKVILEQHYGLASGRYPVSSEELKKGKEYIKGHLALSLEDTKNVNGLFGVRELLLGKIETPDEIFEGIDKVSIEDVVRVAKKFFKPSRLNLAIIGPYKSSTRFERLLK